MVMLTGYILLDVLLIASSLFATLYLWMKWKHTYWQRRGVPTLPAHWFFGHIKDVILMRKSASVTFGELYRQAANEDDVLGIYILHKPVLLLRNPELIKQIVVRDFHVFPNHNFNADNNDEIHKWFLSSISSPKWKHLRTKMSPAFTTNKLKSFFLLIQESGEMMREYVHGQFVDSKVVTIPIKNVFYRYITNVLSSLTFGIHVNCFDTPAPEFYDKLCKALQPTTMKSLQFFFLWFIPAIGKHLGITFLGNYADYFRKVFWDSMDNRNVTKMRRGDLIDSLLQLKEEKLENSHFRFEGDVLVAQSVNFFVAARESSVNTMVYILYDLAKHPEMQKRVRKEILKNIQATNGAITYEAVQNMKYLHQVMNETLRLYPPVSFLERVPIEDYTFPGTKITIEKGIPVYVALYGLQRDPKYYPNPERFDPERFSEERKNEIVPFTFLSFGDGPRNCIGMRLGNLQMALGLILILRDYEVALNSSSTPTMDPRNVFITSPAGLLLDLKKI